jgi:putative phage-type endonuclease
MTYSYRDKLRELAGRQLSGDQRSTAWLQARNNFITASTVAKCLTNLGFGSVTRNKLLLEKASNGAYRDFLGGYYTDIGNLLENLTARYYERQHSCTIHHYNLIPADHPDFPFLAASTDGVTVHDGRLYNVEIKTLVARRLDDEKVKREYYHQMQHQMFCLGLDQTQFLEAKYQLNQTPASACGGLDSGRIDEYYQADSKRFDYLYFYGADAVAPVELDPIETGVYIRSIYWTLTEFQARLIDRNPNWIVTMGPKLKEFWQEVLETRADPARLTALYNQVDTKTPPILPCLV